MIELVAPAKLNLTLRVFRKVGNYHPLDSVVQAISLADRVTVRVSIEDRVVAEDAPDVPVDADNLALRAIAALRNAGVPVPAVEIELTKHIPAGAGLGGGSADAAAALVAGHRLAGAPDIDLLAIAGRVGSDVPALVRGGTTRMTGRGETTEALAAVTGPRWLLVTPPFACSTADVYRRWDEMGGPTDAPRTWPATAAAIGLGPTNDLEPAAVDVQPALAGWLATLGDLSGRRAMVSGSGSSVFVEVDDDTALTDAASDRLLSTARHLSIVRPVAHGPVDG